MGLFGKVFNNTPKTQHESDLDRQIKDDGVDYAGLRISQIVNEKITSKELALQFVLEELDAASHGNDFSISFADQSGFDVSEYKGAMQKTRWTGDESDLEHIQLFFRAFLAKISDINVVVELSTIVVDNIMEQWELGKYQKQSNKNAIYLNTNTGSNDNAPSSQLDYGIKHLTRDGTPEDGMESSEYTSQPNSTKKYQRFIYSDEFGFTPQSKDFLSEIGRTRSMWDAPSTYEYITCLALFRKLILSTRIDRKILLWHIMDFEDTGIAVGQIHDDWNSDIMMTYKMSSEPSQIDTFLATDEVGTITEITMTNHLTNEVTRIPLNNEGIFFMIYSIFSDMHQVDFKKFDTSKMPEKDTHMAKCLLDLKTEMPFDQIEVKRLKPLYYESNDAN